MRRMLPTMKYGWYYRFLWQHPRLWMLDMSIYYWLKGIR